METKVVKKGRGVVMATLRFHYDKNCELCDLVEGQGWLTVEQDKEVVITPDYNVSGVLTHYHVEVRERKKLK